MFYIVGRQFTRLPSTPIQELEWHFFTALVFFTIGFAYLHDRHVRIDILRDGFSERKRAWIEVIGFFVALLPFCLLIIWQGSLSTWSAFLSDERSRAAMGLDYRWIIKSSVPIGALFLLLSGIVVVRRCLRVLWVGGDHVS